MALDLAVRYPKRLACVVAISGFAAFLEEYPQAFSPLAKEQKILVTHGRQDPMVPMLMSKPQIQKFKSLGLNIQWKEYDKTHTIDPTQEMDDIRSFVGNCYS